MAIFEVLCVTMHQKDFSKIKEMNIQSDVVFANQCDRTSYEEYEFDGYTAKMISTKTRGVGINRNLALMYASAEICLLADDDVKYHDNIADRVVSEFESHPNADVIIFHFETNDPVRKQVKYNKTKKWSKLKGLPWGAFRIAFRLDSVKKANVWFTSLFGGGAILPSGEDSMFLMSLRKAGLVFYVSKETIGNVSFETSTWFTGHDEKYFYARGAYYRATHPRTSFLWMLYSVIRIKGSELSLSQKLRWMAYGLDGYKKMLSYKNYKEYINIDEPQTVK